MPWLQDWTCAQTWAHNFCEIASTEEMNSDRLHQFESVEIRVCTVLRRHVPIDLVDESNSQLSTESFFPRQESVGFLFE